MKDTLYGTGYYRTVEEALALLDADTLVEVVTLPEPSSGL